MGSNDMLIVGGIVVVGYALLFTDVFSSIIPPASGGSGGGGEFIDGGGTAGGEFIVEDTANPTGDCKSKYNGKCKSECATDKYSTRCQDCLAVCGGGQGQPPGQCYSVGKDKSVKCGSTSNSCTGTVGKLTCKCGSNVAGNKIRNDRPFVMGGNRTCTDCVTYCKTGITPTPGTGGMIGVTPPGRVYPHRISVNCTQTAATSYNWVSGGKSASGSGRDSNAGCLNARANWLSRWGGGGSTPRPVEPPKKTKSCNSPDRCNWNPGGLNKKCSCGCAGGSWNIGHNTPCSQCETACRARRRQAGYSDAAYFFEDAAESYFDTGTRFANMAMAV